MKIASTFDRDGDLIVVDATLRGPRASAAVRLIVDTGAALTTLAPNVAAAIGCGASEAIRRSRVRTAIGTEYGYIARVAGLHVLGTDLRDVAVNVCDLGDDLDGLLGMNVLGAFNLEIRPRERRIIVEDLDDGE